MEVIRPRLEILNRAGVALLEGRLKPDLCDAAQREAQNLAGLFETMGFGAGSRFAREMQEILNNGAAPGSGAAMRYSELLVALGLDLKTPRPSPSISRPDALEPLCLLIVSGDDNFSGLLEMEALAEGWSVKLAGDFSEGQAAVECWEPDAAIIDMSLSGGDENSESELASLLSDCRPPVPVLALANDTMAVRLEAARRKAQGFMAKSSPLPQIMDAASRLAERRHAPEARVLAAGGDTRVLGQICTLLAGLGMAAKTAADPFNFWEALCAYDADLLVLSDDAPILSATDLCRVVRSDPIWGEIPIIAVAGSEEAIQAIFAAGADDVVAKPIEAQNFLARILNRMTRVRQRRQLAESEWLRGGINPPKSSHMMGGFIELSKKYGLPFCLAAIEVEGQESLEGAADALLELIAHSLRDAFRSGDVLVKWSGSVFVAGMYGLSRFDGLERLDGLIAQLQSRTFMPEAKAGVKVTLRAGVAQFPDDGETIEELFRAAAEALEQAKKAGGAKAVAAGSPEALAGEAARLDIALVMRDEAQAFLLLHELESRGFRARWIKEGKTAKRLIAGAEAQVRPRVVLMDVDLPGIDGVSLLEEFARAGVFEGTRVIMLTEPSVSQRAQAVIELGAYDQVAKPFNPAIVVKHIRRAMDTS